MKLELHSSVGITPGVKVLSELIAPLYLSCMHDHEYHICRGSRFIRNGIMRQTKFDKIAAFI